MRSRARIVILGGGIVGFSVAYNLHKLGERDIVILEREKLIGLHSTGKSAGGFRQQFSTPVNIQMSMGAVKLITRFAEELQANVEVSQNGYIFLATTDDEMADFKLHWELQRSLGLDVSLITPDEIRARVPEMRTDDLVGGTWCATDGFFDPYEFMQGYANWVLARGVELELEAEVVGFEVKDDVITLVHTKKGDIEPEVVVNATGAWAGEIGKMLGVDIPILPYRRQVFDTEPFDKLPQSLPLIVDTHTGLYFKPESGGFLFGKVDKSEPPSFATHVDVEFKFHVAELAINRVPIFEEANLRDGWAGLYEETPDHHAILGLVPPLMNFVQIGGFSGHGAMHAPYAGQLVAELIHFGSARSLDITPLSIERFAHGAVLHDEAKVI